MKEIRLNVNERQLAVPTIVSMTNRKGVGMSSSCGAGVSRRRNANRYFDDVRYKDRKLISMSDCGLTSACGQQLDKGLADFHYP